MEQVGVASVGSTGIPANIFPNVGANDFSSAVLAASAATFVAGQALVDSATAGLKAKYTNATVVTSETITSDGAAGTTFDLAHANVIASSLKVWAVGTDGPKELTASISVGTGASSHDQVVLAETTDNVVVKASYAYHATAVGATGACILPYAVTTTTGGQYTADAVVSGPVRGAAIVDAAGNAVDSYFKAALNTVRFV